MIHSVMRPGTIRINCLRSQPTTDFPSPDLISFPDLRPSALFGLGWPHWTWNLPVWRLMSDPVVSPRGRLFDHSRSGVLEHGGAIGDADLVVVAERGAAGDRLAVHRGPVPRDHVLDVP